MSVVLISFLISFFCIIILFQIQLRFSRLASGRFRFGVIAPLSLIFIIFLYQLFELQTIFTYNRLFYIHLLLVWRLSLVFTAVSILFLVLNQLKYKNISYSQTKEWVYLIPAFMEVLLIVFLYVESFDEENVGIVDLASNASLYFIISFYLLMTAWLCYKTYLYNLDFDIRYIAKSNLSYLIVVFILFSLEKAFFEDIKISLLFTTYMLFNFSALYRTVISQDELSGVNNRNSLSRFINNTLVARHHKGAYLVFIDIDKFKHINDCYGHIEGDRAISLVGKTLKSIAGESNSFVARFGGDEFILVIQNANEDDVKKIIDNINFELEERLIFDNKDYPLTLSSGYVYVSPEEKNIKQLLARADEIMYKHKSTKSLDGAMANG